MGSYNGFQSKGGAQGVGKATTDAVVSASILILAANFIITGTVLQPMSRSRKSRCAG